LLVASPIVALLTSSTEVRSEERSVIASDYFSGMLVGE
jgi:hypothetical protein